MNHLEKLNWRYATKKFDSEKKLSKEQIDTLAQSLRMTASSFGLQPWKFLIISNDEIKSKLLAHSWNQMQVKDCSHLVVFCAINDFGDKDVERFVNDIANTRKQDLKDLEGYKKVMEGFFARMSSDEIISWAKNQVYIALGSFLVTCAELGIDSCPMEGIIPDEYDKVLGLKDQGLSTVVACPVGLRAADDKYAELEKVRFPLDQVVEIID